MKKKGVKKKKPTSKRAKSLVKSTKKGSKIKSKKKNLRISNKKKFTISLNRLIIFGVLFFISLIFYVISKGGIYEDLFFLTSFILAFIAVLFLILTLIFLIIRGMKK